MVAETTSAVVLKKLELQEREMVRKPVMPKGTRNLEYELIMQLKAKELELAAATQLCLVDIQSFM